MADLVYPRAIVQYIGSHGKRPPNKPMLMICHTNASSSSVDGLTNWRYITNQLAAGNSAVTQPFAQVELDGDCWQYLDSNEKGVASYKAEGLCLSIETQDYGTNAGPIGNQAWTAKQVETLAQMFAWGHHQGWWPLQFAKVPIPHRYEDGGLGWHSMWGINTVAEPLINPWTTQKGKTCPASARIAQMPQILERAIAIINPPKPPDPTPTPPPAEDDVFYGPYLIQSTGKSGDAPGTVYACDGRYMTLRKFRSAEALAGYRWNIRQAGAVAPELADNAPIMAVDNIYAFGEVIGALPPPTTVTVDNAAIAKAVNDDAARRMGA